MNAFKKIAAVVAIVTTVAALVASAFFIVKKDIAYATYLLVCGTFLFSSLYYKKA